METFPGNFFSISYCFQIFEIFGWKASDQRLCYHFSLPIVLRCAREARGSSAKTTTTSKKKFEYYSPEENVWQCRGYTRLETTATFFFFSFLLFFSVFFLSFFLRNETRSCQSYSATSEQRRSCQGSWYASVFRLPRIPKNVWNGCTGAKVRITFSYIRSEGFNVAVEINYIKMEWYTKHETNRIKASQPVRFVSFHQENAVLAGSFIVKGCHKITCCHRLGLWTPSMMSV